MILSLKNGLFILKGEFWKGRKSQKSSDIWFTPLKAAVPGSSWFPSGEQGPMDVGHHVPGAGFTHCTDKNCFDN